MSALPLSTLVLATGSALILIGLLGMLTHKNVIRMIIGFSLMDTGTHMVIVALGYVTGRTAPIVDATVSAADAATRMIDPIPSALVLTAIVIGLGVTAVMLSFAIRLYRTRRTLSIDAFTESKW